MRSHTEELLQALQNIRPFLEKHADKLNNELEKDYYWCLDSKDKYNVYADPERFVMGSLEDDLAKTRETANEGALFTVHIRSVAEVLIAFMDLLEEG